MTEATSDTFTIGRSVIRTDARQRITGEATFVYDMKFENMLYGKILRSPHAHARIKNISTSHAEAIEGIHTIITSRDLPNVLHGDMIIDTPTLARERVLYEGEPVAAVAAESPEMAEEVLQLIEVEYEPLPALLNPEEAMKENPSITLHPDLSNYHRSTSTLKLDVQRPNVTSYWKTRLGDVQRAFETCDLIVENTYTTGMAHTWHTEPNVTAACPEPDGTVTVWTSAQNIYKVRQEIAEALDLDVATIRVIVPPYVGGGFGNKSAVNHLEAICVALARKSGNPVKIAFTREEVLRATTVRHPTLFHVKDGVNRDGHILARKMTAIYNGGAYAFHGDFSPRNAVLAAATVYNIPNLWIDSFRVCTNQPSGGAFRGNGGPQGFWVTESQMDDIAFRLGITQEEIRLKNLLNNGNINGLGEIVRDFHLRRCLNEISPYVEARKSTHVNGRWRIGRGLAIGHKWSGSNSPNTAVATLREDGHIDILTGLIELGQGTQTALAQIVSEHLKISVNKVFFQQADTSHSPKSVGAGGSRQLYNLGNATSNAAQKLAKMILESAAGILNVELKSLQLKDGRVNVSDNRSQGVSFGEIASKVGQLEARGEFILRHGKLDSESGRYTEDRGTAYYSGTAAAAEVAINTETGQVKVQRVVCSADVGRALNPDIVVGQVEGGLVMGIGTALSEEMVLDEGKVANPDLKDYKLPSSMDSPRIDTILIETPLVDGPFGAKGVGETSIMVAAPAITNAIAHAVGVRITKLPASQQDILRLLQEKKY